MWYPLRHSGGVGGVRIDKISGPGAGGTKTTFVFGHVLFLRYESRSQREGLGARLLDWAGDIGARVHEARWIRIDVWTTNRRLHAYYRKQGFRFSGLRDLDDDPDYPSRALFERSTGWRRHDYRAVLKPSEAPPLDGGYYRSP